MEGKIERVGGRVRQLRVLASLPVVACMSRNISTSSLISFAALALENMSIISRVLITRDPNSDQ